jgi:tRNA splicing endonuclease
MKITRKRSQSKNKKRSTKKVQSGGRRNLDAALIYGPTENYDMDEWLEIINVDDNDGKILKIEEFIKKNAMKDFDDDDFIALLYEYGMTKVFLNNYNFNDFSIGFVVDNYEELSKKDKDDIDEFCKKYELTKPTFYSGIPDPDF